MASRAWEIAERLSLPLLYAELRARGSGAASAFTEEMLSFGPSAEQHVLLVCPQNVGPGAPLVYFLHGGSWRHGSPGDFRAVGRFLARNGYVTALGGYRLLPDSVFPAQLHDAVDGTAEAVRHLKDTGRPPGAVVLAGQSAGAHLAALAAFDVETRRRRGLGDLPLSGVLAVSGVLDLEVLCPDRSACPLVRELMGGDDGWECADPARFVHGGPMIPVLALHGSRDPLVPVEVAASFVLRANGAEGDHAVFVADPRGHHSDLLRVFFGTSSLTPTMLAWLEDVTAP